MIDLQEEAAEKLAPARFLHANNGRKDGATQHKHLANPSAMLCWWQSRLGRCSSKKKEEKKKEEKKIFLLCLSHYGL